MSDRIKIEKRAGVVTATIFQSLHDDEVKTLENLGVSAVEINESKGWQGGSIAFLKDATFLKDVQILSSLVPVNDLKVLHSLTSLQKLKLQVFPRTPLDFSSFSQLEECNLIWIDGCDSLFDCSLLKSLILIKYGKAELPSQKLTQLRKLQILDSKIKSLDFLQSLKNLKKLRLGAMYQLESTGALHSLRDLVHLHIDSCKGFCKIDHLAQLKKLGYLSLIDVKEVESLIPLRFLLELEALFFFGTTNVLDGKVKFLKSLPKLKYIAFANRRNYDCKREDFSQWYNQYPADIPW
jgi:hypothetical protein